MKAFSFVVFGGIPAPFIIMNVSPRAISTMVVALCPFMMAAGNPSVAPETHATISKKQNTTK